MSKLINFITFTRILLAPVIFVFIVFDKYFICLFIFFIAGLSDFLDGYLARRYQSESQLGEILDPIADKILVIFIFFALSIDLSSYLIAFLSSLILAREIGVAALRDYAARNNVSNRTRVTLLAKTKTSIQMFTIGSYILALALKANLLIIVSDILLIIATLITIYTGYQYALNVFKKWGYQ